MQFIKEEEEFHIKAHLQPDFSCLFFPQEISRARKNSVDLFQEGIGLQVKEVIQFENERSFFIELENKTGLLFKMHGNRANVLLIQNEAPIALFKNKLEKDWNIHPQELHRTLSFSKEAFIEGKGNFKKLYPTFGKLVGSFLIEQGYYQMNLEEQWNLLNQTLTDLQQPDAFLLIEHEHKPALSLLPLGEEIARFTSPIEVINRFFILYTKEYTLEIEKQAALQQLSKILKSSHNYLSKTSSKLYELQNSARNRELADIIMANLHAIPSGVTEIELFDFYHNRPITIRLKKELSPQKNAENYYRKAKNQQLEEQYLQENLKKKEDQVLELETHVEQIQKIENLKELRSYLKSTALAENLNESAETLPYRTFEFEGFSIWIGKGATQNDALLRYYTHKDDLWLHAKGVAGSHVVLKRKAGKNFPAAVKEKAASLAAWYSKRKNDTLCPVICTSRKWVRKIKGASPGSVVVEKEEEVLLVPPTPFQE